MSGVPRSVLVSAGATLLILLAINLWIAPNRSLQLSPTSFGVMPGGYKAAHDLLSELGFPVARSYLPSARVPVDRALWLVSPSFLEADARHADEDANALTDWIHAGGTAVVFGGRGAKWKRLGLAHSFAGKSSSTLIAGKLARSPRELPFPGVLQFCCPNGDPRVLLTAGGAPFALEYAIGKGRLIAIADDRFLRNENLGKGDSSVLLVDLARATGSVDFDEHCHGIAAPVSLLAAIGRSRVMLPIALGLLAALAWMGEQRIWPRRSLAAREEGPAPSIEGFVESLGVLYSREKDPAAVFHAYRAGFIRRLRREISPHADLAEEKLLERLAHDRSLSGDTRRWLVEGAAPKTRGELVIAVRAIESYPRLG